MIMIAVCLFLIPLAKARQLVAHATWRQSRQRQAKIGAGVCYPFFSGQPLRRLTSQQRFGPGRVTESCQARPGFFGRRSKSQVSDAQPVQRPRNQVTDQRAVYLVPMTEAAQEFTRICLAQEPGIIIAGGSLEIGVALVHRLYESAQAPKRTLTLLVCWNSGGDEI